MLGFVESSHISCLFTLANASVNILSAVEKSLQPAQIISICPRSISRL